MSKLTGFLFAMGALVFPLTGLSQQVCQNESEVPSSTPTNRFTNHSDGTVTDGATGLMWSRCAAGLSGADCGAGSALSLTWQGALDHAAGSGLAGYTDWRVPTISELNSIVEQRCTVPAINSAVFPTTPASDFWSASPSADYSYSAWIVSFYDGYSDGYGNRDYYDHVRLVRAGQ